MKTRVVKNNGLYYPQFQGFFGFWYHFSEDWVGDTQKVVFKSIDKAVEYCKNNNKSAEGTVVVWEE